MSRADEVYAAAPGDCRLPARPCRGARVAWLNRRWFGELGHDIACPQGYDEASAWLLRGYAYELDPGASRGRGRPEFAIDAYGTTSLAPYGGSGRAGVINGLQVKGIGRTPLAAGDADWHHSHGFMWLEEALREALFCELIRYRAPCGAVPVIAVVALDERIAGPDGRDRQRALAVRPFRLRPAHLQRALMLERPDLGDPIAAHLCDAARVRQHVLRLDRHGGGAWNALSALAGAYGRQSAHAHTHGWFSGGMTSSNVSMRGEFIDFGSARFVADGRNAVFEFAGQAFGSELETASAVLESLAFYVRKYSGPPTAPAQLGATLAGAYRDQLARGAAALLGTQAPPQAIAPLAARIVRSRASIGTAADGETALALERDAMAECAGILARCADLDADAAMERWRADRARTRIGREAAQRSIERWLQGPSAQLQEPLDRLIRRHADIELRRGDPDRALPAAVRRPLSTYPNA